MYLEGYDEKVIEHLSDERLYEEYISFDSVRKNIFKLTKTLKSNNVTSRQIDKIVKDYIPDLVSPVVKTVVRKKVFDDMVKTCLLSHFKEPDFSITFYDKREPEGPDWILNRDGSKIYGYNHLILKVDSKLLKCINEENTINVLSYPLDIKKYEYLTECNKLCYLNNLRNKIYELFEDDLMFD